MSEVDLTDTSPENQPAIAAYAAKSLKLPIGSIGKNWNPFTNANDDVAVLKHVRETWGRERGSFRVQLHHLWRHRERGGDYEQYEPGDYTLAACRVIQGRESDDDIN